MRTVFIVVYIFLATLSFGQTQVSGFISDAHGQAIPGANVFLLGTYDGTSSDEQGKFEFVTSVRGRQLLVVKFIGYKEQKQEIEILGTAIQINIRMTEEINELQAVTITAGSFSASDVSRRTIFRALDIATTAGATADIAGALNTLPGTQKVGESGRLFVRGGDGHETRTFIDGLVVLDAYSPSAPNAPSRGRFLPFMFKGTSFSTGGYSAEYGQALSSALVLDSKDNAELTRTDFGILSVGGDVGHTQVWERGSIGGKFQYTNLRPYTELINQEIDWRDAPVSLEGSTAFRQRVGKNGLMKVFGNFNHSNFSLLRHDIDDYHQTDRYDLINNYRYLNGFYRNSLNDDWSVRGGFSYTYLKNETELGNGIIDDLQSGVHFKAVAEGSLSDHVVIKAGAEILENSFHENVRLDTLLKSSFQEVITSAFIEADILANNSFVFRTGTRIEHTNLTNAFSADPRVSLAYKMGAQGQFSLAVGRFRQRAKNEFIKFNHNLKPEQADHYILNYQYTKDKRTFRVETYYKRYRDLVTYLPHDVYNFTSAGRGDAKGIELFWRDNGSIQGLDYWISYSFLDTKRLYLDYPARATPSFASKHNFSIVTKYFVQKIKSQLGFTYSFTSGRPYYNPNVEAFHSSRTPNYSDLSFNWSYLPTTSVIVYFSCTNVLGRDNIFGYEYSTLASKDGAFNGRPIRQPAPRFLFLGIFITLSKDKSVNQLPNL